MNKLNEWKISFFSKIKFHGFKVHQIINFIIKYDQKFLFQLYNNILHCNF